MEALDATVCTASGDAAKPWPRCEGNDAVCGARPLKRAVKRYLKVPLTEMILASNVVDASTIWTKAIARSRRQW